MAPAPFPPEKVNEAAEWLSDWQPSILFFVAGIGGAMGFVGRSVAKWAHKTAKINEDQLKTISARVTELESSRHQMELKIVALESLAREIERLGKAVDHGFVSVNERLDEISSRCFVFHSRASAGE